MKVLRLLVLLLTCVNVEQAHGDEEVLFRDSFEYPWSIGFQVRGWTLDKDGGSVYTTTSTAYTGRRSVLIGWGAGLWRSLSDFSMASVGSISIMYDDAGVVDGSAPFYEVFVNVRFTGGTCSNAGLGHSIANSYYRVELCGTFFLSSAPRYPGWHRFEWRFSPGQVELLVDGTLVATQPLSSEELWTFDIYTAYPMVGEFDAFEILGP